MKQLLILILMGFIIGTGAVWGKFSTLDPNKFSLTLNQAKKLPEGMPIILTGRITNQIGPNLYWFSDKSDEAALHILPQVWNGQWINPNDNVTIIGGMKLYKGLWRVDVDRIRLTD